MDVGFSHQRGSPFDSFYPASNGPRLSGGALKKDSFADLPAPPAHRRWLGGASRGGAGVRDEASESQDQNACQTDDAGSLLQPRFDGASSWSDCHQTRESRRDPEDQDDGAKDAERLWRAGSRCHRDQDETKSDSDRREDVERAGSDEALGEPHEAGRRKDADSADSADTKAEHECQGFHDAARTDEGVDDGQSLNARDARA
jgi:hypothetical protein